MRTTVDIDDDLLAEVKAVAVRERRSVRSLIEEGLRRVIIRHPLETAMGESRGGGAPFFAIELNTMSVIMSDMRPKAKGASPVSFTVRDMNRNTQAVLEACRVHGQVLIRSRNGEKFKIEPVVAETPATAPAPAFAERLKQHREKVRALGFVAPRAADMERFHRIVAGEE